MARSDFNGLPQNVINVYKSFVDKGDFVPVGIDDNVINFWIREDSGILKADYMAFLMNMTPHIEMKDKTEFLKAMEQIYDFIEEDTQGAGETDNETIDESNIIGTSYNDAPIVKLVNQTIVRAVQKNASDIHFEGTKGYFILRFRIDGLLYDFKQFNKSIQDAVISRIKVMANLDIAETRKPQDGAIRLNVGTKTVDIRVSIVPSITGEKAVLRILDTSRELLSLSDIGMGQKNIEIFTHKLNYPNGIILVTGPTGSGKTTTLYAALKKLATRDKNIITIEDPIEYRIDGITQVQVNEKLNLNFSNAKYILSYI